MSRDEEEIQFEQRFSDEASSVSQFKPSLRGFCLLGFVLRRSLCAEWTFLPITWVPIGADTDCKSL